MNSLEKRNKVRKALTLVEMVISLAIIMVLIAAMLPQVKAIQDSWASKRGASDAVQNGRILIDHIKRNLSKAVIVTDVSESSETDGYIEFQDNSGTVMRYDIAANNNIEFGEPGSLSEVGGPVTEFKFTCYDDDDLDTPLTISVDGVDGIRFIEVQLTVVNAAVNGQDKTFTTSVYLRTSAVVNGDMTLSTENIIGFADRHMAVCRIDNTHFFWSNGNTDDYVLSLDADTGAVTVESSYLTSKPRQYPALYKIDDTHILKVSTKGVWNGYASIYTIDPFTRAITEGTGHQYESRGLSPALAKIDDTHFLCNYRGAQTDGWACVLTVNPADWTITSGSFIEFDDFLGDYHSVAKIDDNHYLCTYREGVDFQAFVMTVESGTYALTNETPISISSQQANCRADIRQIDTNHFLCLYSMNSGDHRAVILVVNTSDWSVSTTGDIFVDTIESTGNVYASLESFDSENFVCLYGSTRNVPSSGDGVWAVQLTVDTGTWTISKSPKVKVPPTMNPSMSHSPAFSNIDNDRVFCIYDDASNVYGIVITKGGIKGPLLP